jgi:antitoxin component YwqK of YwqJK toxin-antitoxin module
MWHTTFGITMEKEQHYETYKASNMLFYYVLRKEPLGDDLDKVALAVMRDENNSVQQIRAFNQADKQMTPKEAGVSAQALTAVKSDVKSQPKAFLARIKSGEKYSDEELITYWENLGTEQNKIAFLCSTDLIKNENLQKLLSVEHDKELKEILSDMISGKAEVFSIYIKWNNSAGQLHRDNDQPAVINVNGSKYWYRNGQLHRDNDQPATIDSNGTKEWYKNGQLHRDNDKPAVIYSNGSKYWYRNGQLHRDNDQPAMIYSNGSKYWYRNGQLHRDNDQPAVIDSEGTKFWYRNGQLHRDNDQPAVIDSEGTKKWYKNDQRHRDNDQPAVIYSDGKKEWWVNGKHIR